jgi:glutamate-ammonia-ligase adenylyltransferase
VEDAYLFLRRVEHAIQALNDQQTQSLPTEPELRQRMIDTWVL